VLVIRIGVYADITAGHLAGWAEARAFAAALLMETSEAALPAMIFVFLQIHAFATTNALTRRARRTASARDATRTRARDASGAGETAGTRAAISAERAGIASGTRSTRRRSCKASQPSAGERTGAATRASSTARIALPASSTIASGPAIAASCAAACAAVTASVGLTRSATIAAGGPVTRSAAITAGGPVTRGAADTGVVSRAPRTALARDASTAPVARLTAPGRSYRLSYVSIFPELARCGPKERDDEQQRRRGRNSASLARPSIPLDGTRTSSCSHGSSYVGSSPASSHSLNANPLLRL
jgi:hypothetical protein